jgi:aminopeptidase
MKSYQHFAEKYAQLVVQSGVALRKGQSLFIKTGIGTYEFARMVAKQAYKGGALQVLIDIDDPQLTKTRIDCQSESELQEIPDFQKMIDYEMMVKDWAFVRIDNTEDRTWLSDADPSKLSAMRSAASRNSRLYRQSRMRHEHPWCVICAPGPVWARNVLGEKATEEELWDILIPILRLDTDDPNQAWTNHSNTLMKRCSKLNDLHIKTLHFTGDKTDLTIGFRQAHRWFGGGDPLPNGTWFLPNIPTEEVFTVPDLSAVDGHVHTTRPVSVLDSLVEDVALEFSHGLVTRCTARIGQELMERFLSIDDGARRLGEVALVDESSPLARSKRVFGSILYDENASCHLALGAGYPSCLTNGSSLTTDAQLHEAGCNTSLVHTDFMVGSHQTNVTAITRDNIEVPIMVQGRFVI